MFRTIPVAFIFASGLIVNVCLGGSKELCNNCIIMTSCMQNQDGTCSCVAGFHEAGTCDDRNECNIGKHDPCGHRGVCLNTIGSYTCTCLAGWTRPDLHCSTNTSLNPMCMPGYTGLRCSYTLCGHGYAASIPGNNAAFKCKCDRGWTKSRTESSPMDPCDTDIDECMEVTEICNSNGNCTNTPGSYTCSCSTPWTTRNCSFHDVCKVRFCSNNRTCGKIGDDNDNSYSCTCPPTADLANCIDEEFWSHRNSDNQTDAGDGGISKTVLFGSIVGGAGSLLLLLIAGLILRKMYKKAKVGATQLDGGIGSENS